MKLQNKNLSNLIIFTIMKFKIGLFIGILAVSFLSCNENDNDFQSESEAIEVFSIAMSSPESDEAISIADSVINNYINESVAVNSFKSKAISTYSGPKVSLLTTYGIYPATYVAEFPEGYIDSMGRSISGKVYYTFYSKWEGYKTWKIDNLKINNVRINSFRTINNSNPELRVTASDTITNANSETCIRNWNRTRISFGGKGNYLDNSYEITGSATGTTFAKKAYNMQIISPLNSIAGYKYYVSGVVEINTDNGRQLLNFGDGVKDSIATLTLNGVEKQIVLKW